MQNEDRISVSALSVITVISVVIALSLNVLCFLTLTAENSFSIGDIRFWPWWMMMPPVTLIILSCFGLFFLHAKKKNIVPTVIAALLLFQHNSFAAGGTIEMIAPATLSGNGNLRLGGMRQGNAGPDVVDCFAAMEYRFTRGSYHGKPIPFRIHMPDNIDYRKKYPLIVWFHGLGEAGDDNVKQLGHLQGAMEFFVGNNRQDFFLLAIQCPSGNPHWLRSISTEDKGDSPLDITGEIMEAFIRQYPVDENRISLFGLSLGGSAVWEFARKHRRRFAAMAPCSGRPPKDGDLAPYLGTPIWAFNNVGDSGTPIGETERFVETINASGGNAFLSAYEDGGHDAWTRAMKEDKIIGWLILQSLNGKGPPQGIVCRPISATRHFFMFGLPILIIAAVLATDISRRKRGRS